MNGAVKYETAIGEAWQPKDWGKRLLERFPDRLELHWGLECGPGWSDLIAAVCRVCDAAGSPARYTQIKEKFGELRMYGVTDDGALEDLEDLASALSRHICEDCGAPGKTRLVRGWGRTQCDRHHAEREANP